MAYQVLYRKWRPLIFNDVIGQDHVVSTLKNEIVNSRIAHAYLFCGTRGTGKTSVAKIFSRAINCLNNHDGNPCNVCDVCTGILNGSIMDVEEMDAASNNGVDNIRDIREKVIYSTAHTKYKVFIIDEVHMLSTDAFNALLKTLEEPPEHVIFILATTEYHKIPITILSRCQCFDFKRITINDIIKRLSYIAEKDEIKLSEDAINLVAQLGDGSMRDTLSILEQCIASCGKEISYNNIISVLGISDFTSIYDITSAILNSNSGSTLDIFNSVIASGKNATNFVEILISHIRDVMICKLVSDPVNVLNTTVEKIEIIKKQSNEFTESKLNFIIETLAKALNDSKWSPIPQTVFELALVKCSSPELDSSVESLLERIKKLEDIISSGKISISSNSPGINNIKSNELKVEKPKTETQKNETKENINIEEKGNNNDEKTNVNKFNINDYASRWNDILDFIKASGELPTYAYISQARAKSDEGKLLLIFPDHAAINKTIIERPASMGIVQNAVKTVFGLDIAVKCLLEKDVLDEVETFNPIDKLKALGEKFPDIVNIIED